MKAESKAIALVFIALSAEKLPTAAMIQEYVEKYALVGEKIDLDKRIVDEHLM